MDNDNESDREDRVVDIDSGGEEVGGDGSGAESDEGGADPMVRGVVPPIAPAVAVPDGFLLEFLDYLREHDRITAQARRRERAEERADLEAARRRDRADERAARARRNALQADRRRKEDKLWSMPTWRLRVKICRLT